MIQREGPALEATCDRIAVLGARTAVGPGTAVVGVPVAPVRRCGRRVDAAFVVIRVAVGVEGLTRRRPPLDPAHEGQPPALRPGWREAGPFERIDSGVAGPDRPRGTPDHDVPAEVAEVHHDRDSGVVTAVTRGPYRGRSRVGVRRGAGPPHRPHGHQDGEDGQRKNGEGPGDPRPAPTTPRSGWSACHGAKSFPSGSRSRAKYACGVARWNWPRLVDVRPLAKASFKAALS